MALIRGDLGLIGVPDLFRALADEERTGRLSMSREENGLTQVAIVHFRHGDAYHARLTPSGMQLGARLKSAGLASQEDIDGALEMQTVLGENKRLGQVLVEKRLIEQDQLEKIVREQIEDTIFEIMRWDGGEFGFEPGAGTDEDVGIEVSVENLVMEGARRFREWHLITRKVPSLEAIPRFREDEEGPVEVALTPEEWALVSRVDGDHTVAQLAASCGFSDLEAARCVFGLITAGLLELDLPSGVDLPEDDPEVEAALDELERALKEAALDRGVQDRAPQSLEDLVIATGGTVDAEEAGHVPKPAVEIAAQVPPPPVETEEPLPQEAQEAETAYEEVLAFADPEEPAAELTEMIEFELSEEESLEEEPSHAFEGPLGYESEAAPEPEAVAESEPEPVAEAEPLPEFEPEPVPVAEAEPEAVAVAEAEPLPEFEPEPVPVAEPEPVPVADAEPEPLPEFEPEPVPVAGAEPAWGPAHSETAPEPEGVAQHPPSPATAEAAWGAVRPSFVTDTASAPAEAGPRVIAEELVAEEIGAEQIPASSDSFESAAAAFSDLNYPAEELSERVEAAEPPEVPDSEREEGEPDADEDSGAGTEPVSKGSGRPVDPMVDTTALIREFSALGQDEEEPIDVTHEPSPSNRKRPESEGRRPGLFGRRRR